MAKNNSEQEELVSTLYTTHQDLRQAFKTSCDGGVSWQETWVNHTQNQEKLANYSAAMYKLATKVWEPRNPSGSGKCRLEWVRSKCEIYFKAELLVGKKLKVLDVGSCYNPLQVKFPDLFEVLAVDLHPAPGCEDIVQVCDFLNVGIGDSVEIRDRVVGTLPKGHFDVVLFSFFLEYLPDPKQRLESCQRARELLREGGLLFILRPDSNPQTEATARLIKGWKVGLGLLGLERNFLEKLEHLWAMGFVKVEAEGILTSPRFVRDMRKIGFDPKSDLLTRLFKIPQDERKSETSVSSNELGQSHVSPDLELFEELPQLDFAW